MPIEIPGRARTRNRRALAAREGQMDGVCRLRLAEAEEVAGTVPLLIRRVRTVAPRAGPARPRSHGVDRGPAPRLRGSACCGAVGGKAPGALLGRLLAGLLGVLLDRREANAGFFGGTLRRQPRTLHVLQLRAGGR